MPDEGIAKRLEDTICRIEYFCRLMNGIVYYLPFAADSLFYKRKIPVTFKDEMVKDLENISSWMKVVVK